MMASLVVLVVRCCIISPYIFSRYLQLSYELGTSILNCVDRAFSAVGDVAEYLTTGLDKLRVRACVRVCVLIAAA